MRKMSGLKQTIKQKGEVLEKDEIYTLIARKTNEEATKKKKNCRIVRTKINP